MANLLKKARSKHQHGLFIHSLLHWLGWKGIRIYPFYLIQEETEGINLPEFKDNIEEYTFDFLDLKDLDTLEEHPDLKGKKDEYKKRLDDGQACFCAKHQGKIVAHTWFDFEKCWFIEPLFKLGKNEAYMYDTLAIKSYRGKNIAPLMRHLGMEAIRKTGRDTFYSLTEAFNTPAIKYKKKLNPKFLALYLKIDLFRKWKRNFKIREYKT